MGTNTAELCAKVIGNAYQVIAILFMALAQATDCLDIRSQLAPATGRAYDELRTFVPELVTDRPHYDEIVRVIDFLRHRG
jgi:histidine ammonia-lyase